MHGRAFALMTVVGLLWGCGGGDGGTGPQDPGGSGNNGDDREILEDPAFSVVTEIFVRKGCTASSCHGDAESGGLRLAASAAHGELVDVQAVGEPTKVRVIPGNATDSYLVIKLEGRQSFGDRMPQTGSNLDAIDLTNIKNWINQGASAN